MFTVKKCSIVILTLIVISCIYKLFSKSKSKIITPHTVKNLIENQRLYFKKAVSSPSVLNQFLNISISSGYLHAIKDIVDNNNEKLSDVGIVRQDVDQLNSILQSSYSLLKYSSDNDIR